jgi:hypothetical protein
VSGFTRADVFDPDSLYNQLRSVRTDAARLEQFLDHLIQPPPAPPPGVTVPSTGEAARHTRRESSQAFISPHQGAEGGPGWSGREVVMVVEDTTRPQTLPTRTPAGVWVAKGGGHPELKLDVWVKADRAVEDARCRAVFLDGERLACLCGPAATESRGSATEAVRRLLDQQTVVAPSLASLLLADAPMVNGRVDSTGRCVFDPVPVRDGLTLPKGLAVLVFVGAAGGEDVS